MWPALTGCAQANSRSRGRDYRLPRLVRRLWKIYYPINQLRLKSKILLLKIIQISAIRETGLVVFQIPLGSTRQAPLTTHP